MGEEVTLGMEDALDIEDRIVLFPESNNRFLYRAFLCIFLSPRVVAPEEMGSVDSMTLYRLAKSRFRALMLKTEYPKRSATSLAGTCSTHKALSAHTAYA